MTATRRLTDDVQWLYDCHEVNGEHIHISQYLVQAGERYILVDAGLEYDEYLRDAIHSVTDGRGVDVLLLTHSILPHTRSVSDVRDEWDDVTVISAASSAPIVGIDDARSKVVNSTEEVIGREITFMDPLLTDVVNSNWIFDAESKVLFTAEGLGHYHSPDACDLTSGEFEDGIPFEHAHSFQRDKLPFLHYVDPEKLRRGMDALFGTLDLEYLVPAHGNPVERADLETYLDRILRSAETFAEAEGSALEQE